MIEIHLAEGYMFHGGISYEAQVTYREHSRNDASPKVTRTTPPFTGTVAVFALEIGTLQGGDLDALFALPVMSGGVGQTLRLRVRKRIGGRNPTREEIKERLGSIELQVTAFRESRFRQFLEDGRPIWGPPKGFGIMQLDPPPTASCLWDWKENVDRGKAVYAEKARSARGYAARMRKEHNAPTLPVLTAAQLKLETYQRYNGSAYWKPKKVGETWTWIAAPKNNYADESLRIEKLVLSNNPPPDWEDRPPPLPLPMMTKKRARAPTTRRQAARRS